MRKIQCSNYSFSLQNKVIKSTVTMFQTRFYILGYNSQLLQITTFTTFFLFKLVDANYCISDQFSCQNYYAYDVVLLTLTFACCWFLLRCCHKCIGCSHYFLNMSLKTRYICKSFFNLWFDKQHKSNLSLLSLLRFHSGNDCMKQENHLSQPGLNYA